ncbi:MAG: hypothetical protein HZB75_02460 [Candidatus Saccharibacteria bacterium]|nr:MAG: hypothetical protein HZB75_02460 [Candidatus Saccharibacteria bacterium]
MGHGIVSGVNWSVEGETFTIFGASGWVNGSRWMVPLGPSGPGIAPVKPAPIKGDIDKVIAADIADGNGSKIDYVGVGGFQALLLALEGVITVDMLRTAQETPDRIIIENVAFARGRRKLVIIKNAKYTMATFDRNDEVV